MKRRQLNNPHVHQQAAHQHTRPVFHNGPELTVVSTSLHNCLQGVAQSQEKARILEETTEVSPSIRSVGVSVGVRNTYG